MFEIFHVSFGQPCHFLLRLFGWEAADLASFHGSFSQSFFAEPFRGLWGHFRLQLFYAESPPLCLHLAEKLQLQKSRRAPARSCYLTEAACGMSSGVGCNLPAVTCWMWLPNYDKIRQISANLNFVNFFERAARAPRSNGRAFAKFGFDIAENETSKLWGGEYTIFHNKNNKNAP